MKKNVQMNFKVEGLTANNHIYYSITYSQMNTSQPHSMCKCWKHSELK